MLYLLINLLGVSRQLIQDLLMPVSAFVSLLHIPGSSHSTPYHSAPLFLWVWVTITRLWTLYAKYPFARRAVLTGTNSSMTVKRVGNNFLVEFEAGSTEGNSCLIL